MPIARRGSVLEPSSLADNEAWKRSIFQAHLPPGKDELSCDDLQSVLRQLHLPESRVKEIFARADTDGNGWLSYDEFSSYVDRHELELRTAFAAVDTDGSGSISADEIQALLDRMHMSCSPERRDEILKVLDVDGDGKIDKEEFFDFLAFNPAEIDLVADKVRQALRKKSMVRAFHFCDYLFPCRFVSLRSAAHTPSPKHHSQYFWIRAQILSP